MVIRRVSEGSKCFESLVFFNATILSIHIYIYIIYMNSYIIYIYEFIYILEREREREIVLGLYCCAKTFSSCGM